MPNPFEEGVDQGRVWERPYKVQSTHMVARPTVSYQAWACLNNSRQEPTMWVKSCFCDNKYA